MINFVTIKAARLPIVDRWLTREFINMLIMRLLLSSRSWVRAPTGSQETGHS